MINKSCKPGRRTMAARRLAGILMTGTLAGTVAAGAAAPMYAATWQENADYIFKILTEKLGYSEAAACGIMANIRCESTFNPHAWNAGGGSYGLCQWTGGRYSRLRSWCGSNGYDYTTIEGQLAYLEYELENNYPGVENYIRSVENTASGAYDAGQYYCYHFEAPASRGSVSVYRGGLASGTFWESYRPAEWYLVDGVWHYILRDGSYQTDWLTIEDETFFFDKDGNRIVGWRNIDGRRYFFDDEGVMITGWKKIDGRNYYFGEDGALVTGLVHSDGEWFLLDETGTIQASSDMEEFAPVWIASAKEQEETERQKAGDNVTQMADAGAEDALQAAEQTTPAKEPAEDTVLIGEATPAEETTLVGEATPTGETTPAGETTPIGNTTLTGETAAAASTDTDSPESAADSFPGTLLASGNRSSAEEEAESRPTAFEALKQAAEKASSLLSNITASAQPDSSPATAVTQPDAALAAAETPDTEPSAAQPDVALAATEQHDSSPAASMAQPDAAIARPDAALTAPEDAALAATAQPSATDTDEMDGSADDPYLAAQALKLAAASQDEGVEEEETPPPAWLNDLPRILAGITDPYLSGDLKGSLDHYVNTTQKKEDTEAAEQQELSDNEDTRTKEQELSDNEGSEVEEQELPDNKDKEADEQDLSDNLDAKVEEQDLLDNEDNIVDEQELSDNKDNKVVEQKVSVNEDTVVDEMEEPVNKDDEAEEQEEPVNEDAAIEEQELSDDVYLDAAEYQLPLNDQLIEQLNEEPGISLSELEKENQNREDEDGGDAADRSENRTIVISLKGSIPDIQREEMDSLPELLREKKILRAVTDKGIDITPDVTATFEQSEEEEELYLVTFRAEFGNASAETSSYVRILED